MTPSYATGDIVRARQDAPRGYTAESQRRRSELAAAARRGGFAEGQAVHIGWRMLDLDAVAGGEASGPLALQDGVPSVRWSAAGAYVPLDAYLRERIALLLRPAGRGVAVELSRRRVRTRARRRAAAGRAR